MIFCWYAKNLEIQKILKILKFGKGGRPLIILDDLDRDLSSDSICKIGGLIMSKCNNPLTVKCD